MTRYDVAVVGGGPGGYVAAIRAAQLGLRTALIEKETLGGLCLNWGCIPSKALLWNAELVHLFRRSEEFGITYDALRIDIAKAVDRSRAIVERMVKGVEFLLDKNGVEVFRGSGRLKARDEVAVMPSEELIEAETIIVATGAQPKSLPGVETDGCVVMGSREALALRETPRSLVIVGGGPVGVELGYFYRAYGTTVTILEVMDRLLPFEDEDISRHLQRALSQQGISCRTGAKVAAIEKSNDRAVVTFGIDGHEEQIETERVLVAVGRSANVYGLGLDTVGVEMENGFIAVDERLRTTVPNIYAVGDVTGKLPLAHVASAQGVFAVEHVAGREPLPLEYHNMPRCTYCQPQVASLGLTESEARQRGKVIVATFPFRANGKAAAVGATDGFAKLVANPGTGRVLGYHIIGHDATELLGEAVLGAQQGVTGYDVASAVNAHPTLSEVLKEAALALDDRAIHFFKRHT